MRTYETTILIKASEARADYDAAIATVRGAYEGEGATWIELERWDERRLAYPVNGETSALYLIGYFQAPSEAIERIERRARLTPLFLRQLIVVRDGKDYDRIRDQRAAAAAARLQAAEAMAAAEEG